ncbi:capsule assembly Wzi family protein [Mucilaginibacter sp. UR6-11]|uniref:capsule assembly Wzi family protein n=1 Tax=Mucilaginibacter sp. UR6-11 TaxID=1435644 RepID=UPI001E3CA2C7|nr:capsule assembly Wzi family protein [Mucilaginibacter sp. UR6-11]MCC8423967.1 capsule assembly Wzi family protein [Mucilaginibacter sp. UR6-11]
MKIIKLSLVCAFLIFAKSSLYSQSLPVGTKSLEDYFRRAQLQGRADTNVSFTIRPLYPGYLSKNIFFPDSTERNLDTNSTWVSKNGKLKTILLPFSFQTKANSSHPSGWNDGPMIPAKGFQAVVSGGVFVQYGPLAIQLAPEFIGAENAEFDTFDKNHYDVIYARYYDIYNNVDLPARFGSSPYARAYWGQSSIRLNYKSISAGVSTENLWWGPGIRNSLLMSNTAPGFTHLTLNTTKPIITPVGSFEGAIIGGSLRNSNFAPLVPDKSYFGTNLYVPKPNNWRYLSGFIVTWQPKWVPGLFLGLDQTQQMYGKNLNGIKDYLPFFSTIKNNNSADSPINSKDQLSAMFMRWLWPQEHAEIYFEYGKYNNSQNFTQELLNPNNARAYIFGIRKLLPFKHRLDENILINVEVTQLQGTSIAKDIQGQEWYVSQGIRQGYTNQGQEIGAGVGPGGNLQSLEVSWVKGLKKLGLQLERYVHDNDFYYYAFHDSQDYTRHWVDLSMGFDGEWNYKNLIFNAQLQFTNSLDYQWGLSQPGNDIAFQHQINKFNLQIQTGITYRF